MKRDKEQESLIPHQYLQESPQHRIRIFPFPQSRNFCPLGDVFEFDEFHGSSGHAAKRSRQERDAQFFFNQLQNRMPVHRFVYNVGLKTRILTNAQLLIVVSRSILAGG